jgi:hypothetical protein
MVQLPERAGFEFGLDPVHDLRHRLGGDAHARESLVFMLQLPEHDIAAFVYTWVNGQSKAGAAFCAYGPRVGSQAIFEAVDGIAVPHEQGFDDWRVGGVHVRLRSPLQKVGVNFESTRASLEYQFEAFHPAYNYASNAEGCPAWFAQDRFEQSGTVRGVLRLGDREYPFDTFGHRDHSWGTRDWGVAQHWIWLEAQAKPSEAVHVFDCFAQGRRRLLGYVESQGRIAEVREANVSISYDASLVQQKIEATVIDAAGRTTLVRGNTFAVYEFKVSPLATLNEASMSVEINGSPGVGHVEVCWPKFYLDYMRQKNAA